LSIDGISVFWVQANCISCCPLQGKLAAGGFMESMQEFSLLFQPPLTIRNCLPCEIIITLVDSNSLTQNYTIDVGSSVEVHSYDLSRKIHMSMQLQVSCDNLETSTCAGDVSTSAKT